MYTNEFQEYVVDALEAILIMCKEKNKSKDIFLSAGSNHALKRGFINHYPSMYLFDQKYINLYQKYKINLNQPLLQSEKAHILLNNIAQKKTTSKKDNSKSLYWEHFIPNDIIWRKFMQVYDSFMSNELSCKELNTQIKNCFNGQKLVLLTQEEGHLLDKIGGRKCQLIENLTDENIIYNRFKILIEKCDVKAFYLNDKRISSSDILRNDQLSPEIEKYFNDDNFGV